MQSKTEKKKKEEKCFSNVVSRVSTLVKYKFERQRMTIVVGVSPKIPQE